jgi:CopG family nickel-responsive transcriptional regulator
MDERLLARLDRWVERREYPNRSEAVRDLAREGLVEEEWETGDRETVATISYDHHARLLPGRLMAAQHRSYAEIVSALHVHMDADRSASSPASPGSSDESHGSLGDRLAPRSRRSL